MVGWHQRLYGHEFEQLLEMVKNRKPGMLQSMGLQKVGHDLVTEQQQQAFTIFIHTFTEGKNIRQTLFFLANHKYRFQKLFFFKFNFKTSITEKEKLVDNPTLLDCRIGILKNNILLSTTWKL